MSIGAPTRAVFRLPVPALVFPLLLFICATPLASYRVWFLPLYLMPVGALAYVLVTRTTADRQAIVARTLLGNRASTWAELAGFEFHGPRWAIAVTGDGRRFRLPMVRPRDLPMLAAVSGGWLNLSGNVGPTAQAGIAALPGAAAPPDFSPADAGSIGPAPSNAASAASASAESARTEDQATDAAP